MKNEQLIEFEGISITKGEVEFGPELITGYLFPDNTPLSIIKSFKESIGCSNNENELIRVWYQNPLDEDGNIIHPTGK